MTSMRSFQQAYGRAIPDPAMETSMRGYGEARRPVTDSSYYSPTSITYVPNPVNSSYPSSIPSTNLAGIGSSALSDPMYAQSYITRLPSVSNGTNGFAYGSYSSQGTLTRDLVGRHSPESYFGVGEYLGSPRSSDNTLDSSGRTSGSSGSPSHSQRKPSNRDEFDGPHQLLPRPSPSYIAEQDRDLPHLPTNLVVQEQDIVLSKVNDRLSRCAFDFVAKYEFPIPVDPKMRPVERPEDREWTEWVYLLKRLATKRRIPARVLYNGQIKQLVTILENSLEMRHAAKHQSRPLKDDRNILQLISAGIQVAKILRDANAMQYLDELYVQTEEQIQERSTSIRYRS